MSICGTCNEHSLDHQGRREISRRHELAQRLADKEDFELIDVREPYEWEIGRIPGARLIPLGHLRAAMAYARHHARGRRVLPVGRSQRRRGASAPGGRIPRLESHRRNSSVER